MHTLANIARRKPARLTLQISLAVGLLSVLIWGIAWFQLRAGWHSQTETRLRHQVEALARDPSLARALDRGGEAGEMPWGEPRGDAAALGPLLNQVAAVTGGRVVVMTHTGRVWLASEDHHAPGTDLSRMAEIRTALATGAGLERRVVSPGGGAADTPTYFVAAAIYPVSVTESAPETIPETREAVPNRTPTAPVGVVRIAYPYAALAAELRPLALGFAGAGLAAVVLLTGLAFYLAEHHMRTVRRAREFAVRLASGQTDASRLPNAADRETNDLLQALNRTADRLKSQMKKRAREKDRLVTIMHVMNDGVIILNKNGRVRLLNPAAERILRTTQRRALGRSFVQTARDHRIAEIWDRSLASGEQEIAAVELGSEQFVRVAVTPFLKRTARGYLVILQDLTEVRRLQTIRQDFVSNVSHELRTPLASLRALVDTLRDGAIDDPPAAHRFLDRMEVEVDALTQMVAELLELSRIESGQVPLQLAAVRPVDVLGIGAERLRPQTERANITLSVEIPTELPPIHVDSGRIQQVMTNLVHNAIKFTPPRGKITVRAWLENRPVDSMSAGPHDPKTIFTPPSPLGKPVEPARRARGAEQTGTTGNVPGAGLSVAGEARDPETRDPSVAHAPYVVVKVEDTGTGIPASELPRIFERFYKTDRSRALGGTGLGLAISKHIIQLHGGSIWAESDGKSSSVFYFALPVTDEPVRETADIPATQAKPALVNASSAPRAQLPVNPPGSTAESTPPPSTVIPNGTR